VSLSETGATSCSVPRRTRPASRLAAGNQRGHEQVVTCACRMSTSGSGLWSRPTTSAQSRVSRPPVTGNGRRIARFPVIGGPAGAGSAACSQRACSPFDRVNGEQARRLHDALLFANLVGTTCRIARECDRQASARYCGAVLGKGSSSWDYEGAWKPGFAVSFVVCASNPPHKRQRSFRPICHDRVMMPSPLARHT
jgi:hypothetical protein